jgi:hypothetical protein
MNITTATTVGITNYSARKAVQRILEEMAKKGYGVDFMIDEEGFTTLELGGTEVETIYFRNGSRKGWIQLVYDNECDAWDGSDVISDFGGDSVTMEVLEQVTE